ncbi:MAG: hypothetical protein Q8L52_01635 [bacterium]|nr:hypothetical protein [bacterium]
MLATFLAYASVWLMIVVLVLTWLDDMLLPSQRPMFKLWFPAIANGAIWGNMVFLSLVLYLIGGYWNQWSVWEMVLALALGQLVSYMLFFFIYAEGKFPDALAGGGLGISTAGWVTMIYSAFAYAAIGLFYFRTNAAPMDVVIVGALLALYLPIANHAVLGWLNSLYSFPWCSRIFAEESSPMYFIVYGEILVVLATILKLDPPLWKPFW